MDAELNKLWKRMRSTVRGWWLYALPLPLAFDALVSLWTGSLGAMLSAGLAYGGFLVGATVARIGFLKEAMYDEKPFTSPPPRYKALGAGIMALATAFAAYASAGHDLITSGAFAIAFIIGFFLLYGFDPRPGALVLPADLGGEAKEIEAALREAYAKIEGIEVAGRQIRSLEFRRRLDRIVAGSRKVLAAIEENPRGLRRARRFINVYLDGARQVTEKYARTHAGTQAPELEQNFRQLLIDMESVCDEQHRMLTDSSIVDLDVQIEVLATRLKHEGVT
ncbi:MAG: 5-bromo-4-chloroindolyl phosphate hydrolysis family protein [Rhodospirillales bacterium]